MSWDYDRKPLNTESQTAWEQSMRAAFLSFPGAAWPRVKKHYDIKVSSHDEVTKLIGARYPKISLDKLPKTTKELLGSILLDDANAPMPPKYDRNATHDRDPYDKDGGYDRQGFSRS